MTHPEELSCWTGSAVMSRGCSSRFDEFYFDSDSPRAASRDGSRLEPSTSTGETHMSRISLDSRVLWTGSGSHANKVRRLSNPWCDDACGLDRFNIVEPIREETNGAPSRRSGRCFATRTPELVSEKHRPSIEEAIQRLRRIRQEMEEGIEEMHCQMYQIQFCNNALKQERQEKQLESKTLMNRHSPASGLCIGTPDSRKSPSEQIPSSRDTFYESSRSGMDHSPDYCAVSRKTHSPDRERFSVSPIRTPLLTETSDKMIFRTQTIAPPDFTHSNNRCEISGLPIPEVSAFQIEPSDSFTSEGSGQGEFLAGGHDYCFEADGEPCSTRVHAYASRGLKTDVVLNLNSSPHFDKPLKPMNAVQRSPKTSALDKFIGLFCKRRLKNGERTRFRQKSLCQRTKTFGKWSHRSPKLIPSHKQAASCGCKFTDKYPINCDPTSQRQRLQSFCPKRKGDNVELISDSMACSMAGTGRSYVFNAEGVAEGIACFDVTCEQLSSWCYVGIIGKNTEVVGSQESVSECETSYGWSNDGKCFKHGISHDLSTDEPFRTGTNIQLVLNVEAGTLHFRYPRGRGPENEDFVEHEISALPKDVEWSLVIEWTGEGRFHLNSVQSWQ